jgi:hypothetical protein
MRAADKSGKNIFVPTSGSAPAARLSRPIPAEAANKGVLLFKRLRPP